MTSLAAYHRQLFWREFWMWVALACVVTVAICFAL